VKTEQRNVLIGGEIKFQGDRWTAEGLAPYVRHQAQIRFDDAINFYDRTVLSGPVAVLGSMHFPLTRIVPTKGVPE
jgi:hypothetical protein